MYMARLRWSWFSARHDCPNSGLRSDSVSLASISRINGLPPLISVLYTIFSTATEFIRSISAILFDLTMTTPTQIQALLNGPALAPPKGVEPNFENPSNLNTACYAILLSAIVATTTVLCLRLYTRVLIIRKVTLDDCAAMFPFMLKNSTDAC